MFIERRTQPQLTDLSPILAINPTIKWLKTAGLLNGNSNKAMKRITLRPRQIQMATISGFLYLQIKYIIGATKREKPITPKSPKN